MPGSFSAMLNHARLYKEAIIAARERKSREGGTFDPILMLYKDGEPLVTVMGVQREHMDNSLAMLTLAFKPDLAGIILDMYCKQISVEVEAENVGDVLPPRRGSIEKLVAEGRGQIEGVREMVAVMTADQDGVQKTEALNYHDEISKTGFTWVVDPALPDMSKALSYGLLPSVVKQAAMAMQINKKLNGEANKISREMLGLPDSVSDEELRTIAMVRCVEWASHVGGFLSIHDNDLLKQVMSSTGVVAVPMQT